MNTILVAGAGQLGSRHLQGLKKSSHELDIWVYDLSKDSLVVAEERYNQIESSIAMKAHFVSDLSLVPQNIDVVIVATGSKPRAQIVKDILSTKSVEYMVLEKFLFPRLFEYEEIGNLVNEKGVKTWVNCPRRMFAGYEYIKSLLDNTKPVEMSFKGGEWGMCCNTIHFVDIFMYLNGQTDFLFDIDGLLPEVIDSKRPGYVEVLGTESFKTATLDKLTLTSLSEFQGTPLLEINNGDYRIIYNESSGEVHINDKVFKFPVCLQSSLTGNLVDSILDKGNCKLAPYVESAAYHQNYLRKIAPFINKIKGWSSDSCPIT